MEKCCDENIGTDWYIDTVPISYGSVTVEDRWDRQVAWWVATCLKTLYSCLKQTGNCMEIIAVLFINGD